MSSIRLEVSLIILGRKSSNGKSTLWTKLVASGKSTVRDLLYYQLLRTSYRSDSTGEKVITTQVSLISLSHSDSQRVQWAAEVRGLPVHSSPLTRMDRVVVGEFVSVGAE